MYAVIRAGGKQYRVAPGDVIRVEKAPASHGKIEFTDVLAVSAEEGKIGRPQGDGARVSGRVVEEGRGDKVLVFHYKRKKQYKKLAGHRQPFTAVKITEIAFDGHSFKAAEHEAEAKPKKAKAAPAEQEAGHETEHKGEHKHAAAQHAGHAKKASAHKKSAPKGKGKKK
jgi:large subunit ribosomal protein L21